MKELREILSNLTDECFDCREFCNHCQDFVKTEAEIQQLYIKLADENKGKFISDSACEAFKQEILGEWNDTSTNNSYRSGRDYIRVDLLLLWDRT